MAEAIESSAEWCVKRDQDGTTYFQPKKIFDQNGYDGLVYRIAPDGKTCIASRRKNDDYIDESLPEGFEQQTLPLLSHKMASATNDWSQINISLQEPLLQAIKDAIDNGQSIEKAIIDFINQHKAHFQLAGDLTAADSEAITAQFVEIFHTLHNSHETHPHFDEFIVLLEDTEGIGYSHNGHLSISLAEYVKGLGDEAFYNDYFTAPSSSASSQSQPRLSPTIALTDEDGRPKARLPRENAIVKKKAAEAENPSVAIEISPSFEYFLYQEALKKEPQNEDLKKFVGSTIFLAKK